MCPNMPTATLRKAYYHLLMTVALTTVTVTSGCRGPDDKPTPSPPPAPAPTPDGDSAANFKPTIDHLQVEGVIRSWGKDPDIEWSAAITLAEMSKLAYDDDATRRTVLTDLGFENVQPIDIGSTSGFLAMTADVGVVAFRGTDDVVDWIANLKMKLTPGSDCKPRLHKGFQGEYDACAAQVRKHLSRRRPKHVWITGHSLGGAMAACCAYDLQRRGERLTGVVTFGQPRIGNEALAKYLDAKLGDRYLRFMNEGDPVVILPPCFGIALPAYWHSGRRAWFLWSKLYTIDGPTILAEPAPGSSQQPDEPEIFEESEGADAFRSITEADFLELQQQLKAMQADAQTPPAAVSPDGPPTTQTTPQTQGFIGGLARFFMDCKKDHNMDEYLRQLNEFRRKAGSR